MDEQEIKYAGFWIRVAATMIDTALVVIVTLPLLVSIYGWSYFDPERSGFIAGPADFLISWVLPAVAVILFWIHRQGTPGKMLLALRIVDASSGASLSLRQGVVRYLGYFVSIAPLGMGLFWVAFDKRKQGFHDKLAHTVVVRSKQRGTEPVRLPHA
ncbi:MAG: hypothetical protein A3H93_03550 [Rhodocyclales bacterium RIFCSPLOWO2_02_FULL_63_24]|nr:MAG: hypothetical protein A3H93_03550 [Rhodocyclales bacterium RIFCSPLOWO2_02_FULL_63_24]